MWGIFFDDSEIKLEIYNNQITRKTLKTSK